VISGSTRLAAVIGAPIRHSLSPTIFNAAFAAAGLDWTFTAFEVAPGDAAGALAGMRVFGIGGLSVTMPHKQDVAALVDRCSPDAAALGAVNCVVPAGADLIGENTDGAGFVDALRAATGFEIDGRTVVVVGAGGAARAIVLALARAGAREVAVVNRTPAKAQQTAALAGTRGRTAALETIADADLVVNATPVGMGDGRLPFPAALVAPGQIVADVVYHPVDTPLLLAAGAVGATTVDGVGMLVHQAGHAFRHWTGEAPPLDAMTAAARTALAQRD
jgi:shikimate dehydrogenase